MKSDNSRLDTVGRVEIVSFPEIVEEEAYARIDTGAQTSAIWVSSAEIKDGQLTVVFFGKGHPCYTAKSVKFDEYTETVVASSSGHTEVRFKVKLLIKIAGRRIRARFTLADRSKQTYPVLIGRNILRGKFVVDVKQGAALTELEKAHSRLLQSKLNNKEK